jgi:hypothetical protein
MARLTTNFNQLLSGEQSPPDNNIFFEQNLFLILFLCNFAEY